MDRGPQRAVHRIRTVISRFRRMHDAGRRHAAQHRGMAGLPATGPWHTVRFQPRMRAPVSVDAPPTPWPERRVAPGLAMAAGVLVWPAAAALLLSLQFLFQPWVWVNWPVSDVLWAWLFVLRDRLVIALAITLLLAAAAQLPVRELRWRAPALALAVALGALLGEGLLRGADDRPRADLGGVAARWSIVAMAVAAL